MMLYFIYESRDILRSFTLFVTAKTMTKLYLGHHDNEVQNKVFKTEVKGICVCLHCECFVKSKCTLRIMEQNAKIATTVKN